MKIIDTIGQLIAGSLLNCTNDIDAAPSASTFLSKLPPSYILALILSTCLSAATLGLFVLHLRFVNSFITDRYRRALVIFLAATAPFVSIFAVIAQFMPKTWLLAHLLSFFWFSIALYVIICLLFHLVQGRASIVEKMSSAKENFVINTPPFCCLFSFMPMLTVQSRRVRICELAVLQTPALRLVATILSLIIYFEYSEKAIAALKVLDFIALPSLLVGIYGTHILVNTVARLKECAPYRYIVIFRLLDIYFLFFGLQMPVFDFFARVGFFGCRTDFFSALETAFFWKNFAVTIESFCVSLISTLLLKPSQTLLFDKYYTTNCRASRSSISAASIETQLSNVESTQRD